MTCVEWGIPTGPSYRASHDRCDGLFCGPQALAENALLARALLEALGVLARALGAALCGPRPPHVQPRSSPCLSASRTPAPRSLLQLARPSALCACTAAMRGWMSW